MSEIQANPSSRPPAYLWVVAAYPPLFIAQANPGQAAVSTVALVAAVSVVTAALVWVAIRNLARSGRAAAAATAVLILMFYGYGQFGAATDAFVTWLQLGDNETPNALDLWPQGRLYIALVWGAIALAIAWGIARARWPASPDLSRAANFAAAVLLLMLLVPSIARHWSHHSQPQDVAEARDMAGTGAQAPRDVFFIVLDGYARDDVLSQMYHFDNGPFLSELARRGWQVPRGTSSNYSWTFLSLASMLNMDYVEEKLAAESLGPDSTDRKAMYDWLRNNAMARFLRQRGYEIVHLRSTWGATSTNPDADREIRCESGVFTNEFIRALVEASWWGAFHSKSSIDLAQCNLSNFAAIGAMRPSARPKFVFAHFILPHHPYLFDREGRILKNARVSNQFDFQNRLWEDRDSYRDQLEFVNRKVLETVDVLVSHYDRQPIIVIASDHGPSLRSGLTEPGRFAVRFASFGAYYLPDAPPGLMPDFGTAVNQFRRILSHYFEVELAPLPDRHFTSPFQKPYKFREVPHEKLRFWWTRMNDAPHSVKPDGAATD